LSLEPFLGGDQTIVKLLAVGYLSCTSWFLLMLDLVPEGVGLNVANHCGRASWWGERDWRRIGGRNDGGVLVTGEQGVIITVVICIKQ
jgi:hypothetical protein